MAPLCLGQTASHPCRYSDFGSSPQVRFRGKAEFSKCFYGGGPFLSESGICSQHGLSFSIRQYRLFVLFVCLLLDASRGSGSTIPLAFHDSVFHRSVGETLAFFGDTCLCFPAENLLRKSPILSNRADFFLLTLAPYFLNRDPYVVQNVFLDSTIHLRTTPHSGWPLVTHELFHWGTNGVSRLNPLIYLAHLGLAYFLAKKSYDLVDSLIIYLLFFYSTSVYVAPQYSLWVIPFAALRKDKTFFGYSLITTVHLVAFYFWATWQALGDTAHMEDAAPFIKVFRGLAWAVSLFWLIKKLRAPVVRAGN